MADISFYYFNTVFDNSLSPKIPSLNTVEIMKIMYSILNFYIFFFQAKDLF